MTTWFTADFHFGHASVLKYTTRPWKSADEMDAGLIANWNGVVADNDDVYFLGDFSFRKAQATADLLAQLKGRIRLILGNHDKAMKSWIKEKFVWVKDLTMVTVEEQKIVLCHYPLFTWDRAHYGTWALHGHSHGGLQDYPGLHMDVGVDCHPEHRPFSFEEVKTCMATRTFSPVDHHGRGAD